MVGGFSCVRLNQTGTELFLQLRHLKSTLNDRREKILDLTFSTAFLYLLDEFCFCDLSSVYADTWPDYQPNFLIDPGNHLHSLCSFDKKQVTLSFFPKTITLGTTESAFLTTRMLVFLSSRLTPDSFLQYSYSQLRYNSTQ